MANNIAESLSKLEEIDGFVGASLTDSENGMVLGFTGGGHLINIEVASAANTEVVKAKRRAIKTLNLNQDIEDILITLETQYHLIRPLKSKPHIFFYLALSRDRANLALARHGLAEVEKHITF